MTAAEMMRAMDLYRQLSGKPLVAPRRFQPLVPEPAAPPEVARRPPPAPAERRSPHASDATVTALDVTRKRP